MPVLWNYFFYLPTGCSCCCCSCLKVKITKSFTVKWVRERSIGKESKRSAGQIIKKEAFTRFCAHAPASQQRAFNRGGRQKAKKGPRQYLHGGRLLIQDESYFGIFPWLLSFFFRRKQRMSRMWGEDISLREGDCRKLSSSRRWNSFCLPFIICALSFSISCFFCWGDNKSSKEVEKV